MELFIVRWTNEIYLLLPLKKFDILFLLTSFGLW